MKRPKRSNAIEILHRRYIGTNPERLASLREERVNAKVARTLCDMREEAGLTQKQLAERIGTIPSVIREIEDGDFAGHSQTMLGRIAKALGEDGERTKLT